MTEQQPTCGQGLAAHAVLPAAMASLLGAMAATLELHQQTIDLTDERGRLEDEVYVKLAMHHRIAAEELRATAAAMTGYQSLPMAPHDEEVLASPELGDAFADLVAAERELAALLQRLIAQHEAMLA